MFLEKLQKLFFEGIFAMMFFLIIDVLPWRSSSCPEGTTTRAHDSPCRRSQVPSFDFLSQYLREWDMEASFQSSALRTQLKNLQLDPSDKSLGYCQASAVRTLLQGILN